MGAENLPVAGLSGGAHELVRVEDHDLVLVRLVDEDALHGGGVRRHHREIAANDADDALHRRPAAAAPLGREELLVVQFRVEKSSVAAAEAELVKRKEFCSSSSAYSSRKNENERGLRRDGKAQSCVALGFTRPKDDVAQSYTDDPLK
jgi:hypothetical protein